MTPEQHFAKYKALREKADASQAADDAWEVVLRFYAALHLVDAWLTQKRDKGQKALADYAPTDHSKRRAAIRSALGHQPGGLKFLLREYDALKGLSEAQRYTSPIDVPVDQREKARGLLTKIEAMLTGLVERELEEK